MSTHDINGRPTDPDTHTRRVVQTEWGPMPVISQVIDLGDGLRADVVRPAKSAGAVLTDHAHMPVDLGESGRAAVQGIVNEIAAKVAPGHEPPTVVWTKPDDGRNGLPLGFFDDVPFMYEFTDANGPMRCHPASGVGPLTLRMKRPHVATLPNGRTVDLPAGTVLREGMTCEGPPADRGASPLLAQARDLLRAASLPLSASEDEEASVVLTAIDAFLAGLPAPNAPQGLP